MLTMSNNVGFRVQLEGSVGNALCLSCCGGESALLTHYHILPGNGFRGDVLIAPSLPGEVALLEVTPEHTWSVQQCGFVACDQSVDVCTRIQRLTRCAVAVQPQSRSQAFLTRCTRRRCCCAGEGFVILKCSGRGRLIVNSFGSICRYDVKAGEQRVVDNGALVAWSDHMQPIIKLAASGALTSLFSGEGFVCVFTGPGTVYVQTRAVSGLGYALAATGLKRMA